jgi:ELWxxDGT repeat protein
VLYFPAHVEATTGQELWRTDGTPAGTEVLDLVPGPLSSLPQYLRTAGGRLYFAANHLTLGREVYHLVSAPLFSDGFNTGNTSAWDAQVP